MSNISGQSGSHQNIMNKSILQTTSSLMAGTGLTENAGSLDVNADLSHVTALGTQSEDLNMGSNKVTNVTDPTADQDASTKAYVDGLTGRQIINVKHISSATTSIYEWTWGSQSTFKRCTELSAGDTEHNYIGQDEYFSWDDANCALNCEIAGKYLIRMEIDIVGAANGFSYFACMNRSTSAPAITSMSFRCGSASGNLSFATASIVNNRDGSSGDGMTFVVDDKEYVYFANSSTSTTTFTVSAIRVFIDKVG